MPGQVIHRTIDFTCRACGLKWSSVAPFLTAQCPEETCRTLSWCEAYKHRNKELEKRMPKK